MNFRRYWARTFVGASLFQTIFFIVVINALTSARVFAQSLDPMTLMMLTRQPEEKTRVPASDFSTDFSNNFSVQQSPNARYQVHKHAKRKPAQVLIVPEDKESDLVEVSAPSKPLVRAGGPLKFSDHARDLFLGGTADEIQKYREALKPDDIRLNRFEISLAPLFIYNDSKSSNWARTYQTASAGYELAAAYWFSPTLALELDYQSTLSSTVTKAPGVNDTDKVQDRWLTAGFRFRRFYGSFFRPTQLTLSLDYNQYDHDVDLHNADVRNRFTDSGPRVAIDALFPASQNLFWRAGFELIPFGYENEQSTTTPQIVSGAHAQTMLGGVWIGPEYKFDRADRLFFKLKLQLSKTTFDSMTSYASPTTGTVITNEAITNSFFAFILGYTWGH